MTTYMASQKTAPSKQIWPSNEALDSSVDDGLAECVLSIKRPDTANNTAHCVDRWMRSFKKIRLSKATATGIHDMMMPAEKACDNAMP